jgi:hypothetical protein
MVHYVRRTAESIVLTDAQRDDSYGSDPYIVAHKPCSVMCLPVLNQARLVGILYLEHTAISGVFTPARIQVLQMLSAQPPVHYVVTLPGPGGVGVAFVAEVVITFLLMAVILTATNTPGLARYTGLFAGALVATYITVEAPLSGMSMNPARTFASALPAQAWTALWVYFSAPLLGMLCAAELYVRRYVLQQVICAKLHHQNAKRCIFAQCGYQQRHAAQQEARMSRTSGKANADHGSAIWSGSARIEGATSENNR